MVPEIAEQNSPRFLEEGVELVPPAQGQAALREAVHLRRVLGERRARPPEVRGAVHHLVLQRPSQAEHQRRREGWSKIHHRIGKELSRWEYGIGKKKPWSAVRSLHTSDGVEEDLIGEILGEREDRNCASAEQSSRGVCVSSG